MIYRFEGAIRRGLAGLLLRFILWQVRGRPVHRLAAGTGLDYIGEGRVTRGVIVCDGHKFPVDLELKWVQAGQQLPDVRRFRLPQLKWYKGLGWTVRDE